MKGQTLIEVLVALTLAVIVISAITVASVSTLNNTQYIRDQSQATKYAQEGSEIVRRIRNSDYVGFRSYTGLYCLADGQSTLGEIDTECDTVNVGSKFVRYVRIAQNGCNTTNPNVFQVTVTVAYASGKCSTGTFCHKSELVSCLSTTNPVSGP